MNQPYFDVMNVHQLRNRAERFGSEPYWFGLGFIQLKLSDTERMHFWTPAIPRKEREEIHNHRYNFTSLVLAGKLKHQTFYAVSDVLGAYELFQTNCSPEKEGTVETVTPHHVFSSGYYEMVAGTKYFFPHYQFHTTEETLFAITYLRREPKVKEFADVIKTRGAGTTCLFAEKIPAEICWQYIAKALDHAVHHEKLHSIPCRACGAPSGQFGEKPSVKDVVCGYCNG